MNKIDPLLIESIALQLHQMPISHARAREIASEIEALLAGLDNVLPGVDFLEEPDGFRAALWALRDPGAEEPLAD
jgi:hypothetical protein